MLVPRKVPGENQALENQATHRNHLQTNIPPTWATSAAWQQAMTCQQQGDNWKFIFLRFRNKSQPDTYVSSRAETSALPRW